MSTKSPKNKPITDERPIVTESEPVVTTTEVEAPLHKPVTRCFGEVLANTLLNVRETASMDAKVLGTLAANTKVEIMSDADAEFYQIKAKEISGYCKKDFIKLV